MHATVLGEEVEIEQPTCCGTMEALKKVGFEYPFEMPMHFDQKTGEISFPSWGVRVLKETPSGRVTTIGSALILMTYCPFCGKKLGEAANE